jgi:protein O-mannosyl-transferase
MAVRHRSARSIRDRRFPNRRGCLPVFAKATAREGKHASLRPVLLICLGLITLTWLVFGQTLGYDFVNFDDHVYVYENPQITHGLTVDSVIGAFTHAHARNWHPLTTISHMLDCQLFGLKAGGHHFTNVLLHTIAVLLLFVVLKQMTGAIWQSAFVAAVFAVHPLHVESVAWVAERKDVLSAVFFMLTMGAYVRYVRRPSSGRYLAVAVLFALGLMCKPMLVTLPFVLLLLDYWPLDRLDKDRLKNPKRCSHGAVSPCRGPRDKRLDTARRLQKSRQSTPQRLFLEKIPLFVLSAASCVATLLAQRSGAGAIDQLPFMWRLNNGLVSYVTYVWQMILPARLAVFYPHPNNRLALWQITLAIAFLVIISLAAILLRKKSPYLLTGWFWYLGMLVPVIGLVQVGEQAHADRYTYLPQIGLYILIAWAAADLTVSWRARRAFVAIAAPMTIAVLMWCAFIQTSHWKNSETLWTRALAVTSDNDVAHNNLGFLFLRQGELDSAISHFNTALNIRSGNAATHYNLGAALIQNNLANALARKGLRDKAITHYEEALKLRPDYADAYYNFGSILLQEGRIDEAIARWQKALMIRPRDGDVHTSLGNAFLKKGLVKEAISHYQQALEISPQDALARNNFAWLLATTSDASVRDGAKAIELAEDAVQLSGGRDPNFLRTLAAAYAESGRFAEAITTARQARVIASLQGKSGFANVLDEDLGLYREHVPLRRTKPSD